MGSQEVVPTRLSGYQQHPNSININSDLFFELVNKTEVPMKTGKNAKKETTIKLNHKLNFKLKLMAAVLIGCLLVDPLTKAYNIIFSLNPLLRSVRRFTAALKTASSLQIVTDCFALVIPV